MLPFLGSAERPLAPAVWEGPCEGSDGRRPNPVSLVWPFPFRKLVPGKERESTRAHEGERMRKRKKRTGRGRGEKEAEGSGGKDKKGDGRRFHSACKKYDNLIPPKKTIKNFPAGIMFTSSHKYGQGC